MLQPRYTVDQLPVEFSLPRHTSWMHWAGRILKLLGWIMVPVGGGFFLFGPDSIWVNSIHGPTLIQFLQLYGGPIATIGLVAYAAGSQLITKCLTDQTEIRAQLLQQMFPFTPEHLPPGKTLGLTLVQVTNKADIYRASLVDQEACEENSQ